MARMTDRRRAFSLAEAWVYDVAAADGSLSAVSPLVDDIAESLAGDDRVLDVGCGGGQAVLALAQARPDVQVVGIDPSTAGLRRAARRTGRAPANNAFFARSSALSLPFPTNTFAASVAFFSIKHWPEPRAGIAELVRVTRPGGQLVVVEVDAHATPVEWRRYVDLTRVPRALRGLFVRITRHTVVRPSLGRDALAAGFQGLPVDRLDVRVVNNLPCLVARAHTVNS